MSIFGETYSKYYNLLYKDKNYKEEFDYLIEIINKYGNGSSKTVLDIGCGTGKHLKFFKDTGYDISGIDLSENMIKEAKKYLLQDDGLFCCSASEFKINKKFDVIISLFHVMSYQILNVELKNIFKNIKEHLVEGGLFIFDFWYGPAVLTDTPVVRIKHLEDNEIKIARITEPVMHSNTNIVDVNFEVLISDKKTNKLEVINETHKMRYLFLPEIEMLSEFAGLQMVNSYKWMTYENLSFDSWYGLAIIKKQ